jgi:hypothetical protein
MKTDEHKPEYVTEAMGLLRGEPSLEIEEPRNVVERRGGKLVEVEREAFIKLYTSFKKELKEMEGNDLKVWVFIALSVNRITKNANPGLREIAEKTGLAVNTVRSCVERLDEKGLLNVEGAQGKGNVYRPADYVSVSKNDTAGVSKNGVTVSKSEPTVSTPLLQTAQLEELELTRKPLSIENSIFADQPVTEEMVEMARVRHDAPRMFEKALGFSKPLPWWSNKEWTVFSEWVCERHTEDRLAFGKYNIWRNTPFTKGGMSNNRIRGFPAEFYDSWDMFSMVNKPKEETEFTRLL